LGLSLVKHIVNRHRGRLLIESVLKNGATFTACFPQAKSSADI
jgi:two-component system, OmpR family, phosphate regulon sensor histidine kinase PhoR